MKTATSERYRVLIANNERYSSGEVNHAHAFVENVVDARDNGHDVVCVECGMGMGSPDGMDEHEDWCELEQKNTEAEAKFAERLKGILGS